MGTTSGGVEWRGDGQESSLRDILSVIFRHKWKSLIFFLLVAGLVTAGTFMSADVYESQAKLLLKLGRETSALDPTLPGHQAVYIRRTMEEQLRSELEILNSRVLVEEVVKKIGPAELLREPGELAGERRKGQAWFWRRAGAAVRGVVGLPGALLRGIGLLPERGPREEAIRKVTKGMRAEALRSTNILYLAFRHENPDLAQKTLATFIDEYLARHLKAYQSTGTVEFFQDQTREARKKLTKAEDELGAFKNRAGIANLHEQHIRVIKRLNDLKTESQQAAAHLSASAATVSELERSLAKLPPTTVLSELTGTPNFFMDDARNSLLKLRLEEADLLKQYPETNRLVRSVRERIRKAEESLAGEPNTRTQTKTGINDIYQKLELRLMNERATLAALKDEKAALDEQVEEVQAELRVLNVNETELVRLKRQMAMSEQDYRNYADRLEEARSAKALQTERISNVSKVQEATVPGLPVSPRRGLNVLIGLLLGLFGGIGLAFLSDYLDHTFRTGEQVEKRLGLPVLVSIPKTGDLARR